MAKEWKTFTESKDVDQMKKVLSAETKVDEYSFKDGNHKIKAVCFIYNFVSLQKKTKDHIGYFTLHNVLSSLFLRFRVANYFGLLNGTVQNQWTLMTPRTDRIEIYKNERKKET